jgi:amino acid permease
VFQGFFDVLPLYMVTVLNNKDELEISIIMGFAMFAVLINSMFYMNLNYFEKASEHKITSNDMLMSLTLGVASFAGLYVVRFV